MIKIVFNPVPFLEIDVRKKPYHEIKRKKEDQLFFKIKF